MGANGVSRNGINRVGAAERQRRALQLRAGGAAKAIGTALRRTIQEPADALRALEAVRLDALQLAMWSRALKGDLEAVDRVLKIMERRARLLGLDAPQAVTVAHSMRTAARQVADSMGLDVADVIAEAERTVAAIGRDE